MLLSIRTQRVLLLLSLLFALSAGFALAQHPVLDGYVMEGLERNIGLQQQHLAVAQQQQALTEAEALYRPSLALDARFSRAGGGRTIDFPVGQLLNPVYDALNQQRVAVGLDPAFPTIADEQINFLRTQEQETKLRVVQPIYQPSIRPNIRLHGHLMGAAEAALATSQHELVATIKTAYFDYLKAERLVEILTATGALVDENVRVNESLARNGKVTQDAVYRARTDQYDLAQQQAEAAKNRDLAASYFNYLLARPFETPIERISERDLFPEAQPDLEPANVRLGSSTDDLAYTALSQRTELAQLDAAIQAAGEQVALTDAHYLPSVALVADYGIQGRGYGLGGDNDFWMGSVVLSWNLFDGFQRRAKRQRARLGQQQIEAQRRDTEQQIRLHVQEAFDNVRVAEDALTTADARLISAQQTFRLVQRKYQEGMANQVEYIDARTALTNAELNRAITRYDYLSRSARLERALGEVQGSNAQRALGARTSSLEP
ncbi:MAG: hypothetical protein RhofKO_30780 [Rhodothermales bacterium]